MIAEKDIDFMRRAIAVAVENGADPTLSPIGCVIVRNGEELAASRNLVAELADATAHAEMLAHRIGGKSFENGELRGAILYSTLQPCGMCTMAAIWAKVQRIVFGAARQDVHRMYFEARHVDTIEFVRRAYRDDLSI